MSATEFLDAYLQQHCNSVSHTRRKSTVKRSQERTSSKVGVQHDKAHDDPAYQLQLPTGVASSAGRQNKIHQQKKDVNNQSPKPNHNLYIAKLYDVTNIQHQSNQRRTADASTTLLKGPAHRLPAESTDQATQGTFVCTCASWMYSGMSANAGSTKLAGLCNYCIDHILAAYTFAKPPGLSAAQLPAAS